MSQVLDIKGFNRWELAAENIAVKKRKCRKKP